METGPKNGNGAKKKKWCCEMAKETPISNISFSFFISDPTDDNPIPSNVILLGRNSGQVRLPSYKYYTEEEVKGMIDQLELDIDIKI